MALFQNFTTEIEVCESLVLNTASVCSAKSQFAARGTVLVLAEMNQQEHAERNPSTGLPLFLACGMGKGGGGRKREGRIVLVQFRIRTEVTAHLAFAWTGLAFESQR